MKYAILGLVAVVVSGCASDVTMLNPRTGETHVCAEPLKGFNPWSQTDACVADHEAQGWVVAKSD
jgi:hypothetical protein